MAIFRRYRNLKEEENTGFGANANNQGGRFVNRDGAANVIKKGGSIFSRLSLYHTMLGLKRKKFLFLLLLIYISINLFFAGIYYIVGIDHLQGVNTGSNWKNFTEVFFFSAQTFTTVGYGRISPTGFLANAVSTIEAFLGLLSFAIATGLFYGRFSHPKAFLKYSDNALIAPYREGKALMFRMVSAKNNNLSEVEVKLTMAMTVEENGKIKEKFFNLDLEISKINSMVLSWTVVHPINEQSPLYGFEKEDFSNTEIELMVFVKAFDEVFSNTVISRTSYISKEIIWGAKFKIMYHPSNDNRKTILDVSKLNDYDLVSLPDTLITTSELNKIE